MRQAKTGVEDISRKRQTERHNKWQKYRQADQSGKQQQQQQQTVGQTGERLQERYTRVTVIVGSHGRRSLQLFPRIYYHASSTLRSKTNLPLKKKKKKKKPSTYVKNNHTMY